MLILDPLNVTFIVLIEIAIDAMAGSLNMLSIYERFILDKLKILELNKTMAEILSEKNVKASISQVSGQIMVVKQILLSPIYSAYIYIYGMPDFGVGFDFEKLAFLGTVITSNVSM